MATNVEPSFVDFVSACRNQGIAIPAAIRNMLATRPTQFAHGGAYLPTDSTEEEAVLTL
jgi:hypothetical protein